MAASSENDFRRIYEHCYKGSEIVNIFTYFEEYKKEIEKTGFGTNLFENEDKKFLSSLVGDDVDENKFDILADYCSIDKLTVAGELQKTSKANYEWCKEPSDPSIIDAIELQTVINTRERNGYKQNQVYSKYRSERPIVSPFQIRLRIKLFHLPTLHQKKILIN